MAKSILTFVPRLQSRYRPEDGVAALDYHGKGAQRVKTQARRYRRYFLNTKKKLTDVIVLDTFFDDRGGGYESFLWLDPWLQTRTDIAGGTATASQTVFPLPTGSPYGGDYPVDNATAVVELNGTPETTASVQVDARTITVTGGGASGGETITLSYDFYRLVALPVPIEWTQVAHGDKFLVASFEFAEVSE